MLMAAAMLVKIVGGHECRHERGQKFVGMACAGNLDEVARLVMRRSWVHLEEIAEKNAPQVSRPVEGERGVGAAITLFQTSRGSVGVWADSRVDVSHHRRVCEKKT